MVNVKKKKEKKKKKKQTNMFSVILGEPKWINWLSVPNPD